MKRRASTEGNLRHRPDGRWEARLRYDGKRESIYGATQREVLEKAKARKDELAGGLPIVRDRQSLAAYLEDWLDGKRSKLRPRTHVRYCQLLRVHVIPTLGKVALTKVTPQALERLYAARLDAGSAARTVRHVHAVTHNALEQAAKWGLVARNVASLATPPAAEQHEMVTFDEKQLNHFLGAAMGERFEALFVIAVTTGMRQGELLALRWRDVDLDRATLSVRQSLQWTKQGPLFTAPKTKKSRRQIELTRSGVATLRAHRKRMIEQRLAVGDAWEENDLVFPNEIGKPMDGSNLSERDLRRVLTRSGLPRIRFHDLRHTAATILLGRGVHPKLVSEMLGHADVRITLDLYSHVTPTMHREAAAVFDKVLEGAR
jgi:integrase